MTNPHETLDALRALARERGIDPERLMDALADALLAAYHKQPHAAKYARVELDHQTASFRVLELVVPPTLEARLLAQAAAGAASDAAPDAAAELDLAAFAPYRAQISEHDVTPDDFGRVAAQTARQVIAQRLGEAESEAAFAEYSQRVGELVIGVITQADARHTTVGLGGGIEATLPRSEQVAGERYLHAQRVRAIIKDVSTSGKDVSIILSRSDRRLVTALFVLEVPELADGLIEVVSVARAPGQRTKIAVRSNTAGVDAVGACIGPRGARVRAVVSELRGEKVDVVAYDDEPARFVAGALVPARIREVLLDDERRQMTVVVPDDQLGLAHGAAGVNVALAEALTGWRIELCGESNYATANAAGVTGEDEGDDGRCVARNASGRRCPNTAVEGSRYCGLSTHQELALASVPLLH